MLTNFIKLFILGSIGLSFCGIFTHIAFTTHLKSIRQHEFHILTQISIILSEKLDTTFNQNFVSTYMGELRGSTTREQFDRISRPLIDLRRHPTSVGWIPIVKPQDRDDFIIYANTQYPDEHFNITTIDYTTSDIIPRPYSNETMWPILFSNPITTKFTGFDIYIPWKEEIQDLIDTRDVVLVDLVALEDFGGIGDFIIDGMVAFDQSKEPYIFMILQPVFDYITVELLGMSMEIAFPQGIIENILNNVDIGEIDDFSLTVLRKTRSGPMETVYDSIVTLRDPLDDFTDRAMNRGDNIYIFNSIISGQEFRMIMSSRTCPPFKTYGAELLGGVFIIATSLFLYSRQVRTASKYQALATSYKKETDKKSVFLAEISHELRTPLNGIVGTIDILASMDIDENMKEYVNDIKECSIILLKNISEILDFSKIEAGKLTFNIEEPVRLDSFIHGIIRIMSHSYNRDTNSQVRLILHIHKDFPSCLFVGDTGKLRQVLMNLVSNAFKFTDTGSITVHVECQFIDFISGIYIDNDEYNTGNTYHVAIDLSVTDTGIGMGEEKQVQIFEAFSQVHTGRASVGGTGLGLVITKAICEAMGGNTSCTSKQGRGSTFKTRMIFGVRKCDIQSHRRTSPPEDTYTEWVLINEGIEYPTTLVNSSDEEDSNRILIVDDIVINRKVLTRILNSMGIKSETACDGASAIEMCRHTKYCMILMDYYMPGMNGPDTTRVIRMNSMNNDTTIIGVTASLHQDLFDEMIESGMDEYIQKPVQVPMIAGICKKYNIE